MVMGQVVLDMGMKRRVDAVGSLWAALDLQGMAGVVVVMKVRYAKPAVQVVLDFDMTTLVGVADMLPAALFAGPRMEVVEYIDTACDPVVWVSFESRLRSTCPADLVERVREAAFFLLGHPNRRDYRSYIILFLMNIYHTINV